MISRRGFLGSAAVLASASAVSGRVQAASIPEAPTTRTNTMQPPLFPSNGPDYQPVVTTANGRKWYSAPSSYRAGT